MLMRNSEVINVDIVDRYVCIWELVDLDVVDSKGGRIKAETGFWCSLRT